MDVGFFLGILYYGRCQSPDKGSMSFGLTRNFGLSSHGAVASRGRLGMPWSRVEYCGLWAPSL